MADETKQSYETRLEESPRPKENAFSSNEVLKIFSPVLLDEIQEVRLLKRSDTKFLFHESLLPGILKKLTEDYHVLEVKGERMQRYKTRYYDTPDFELYHQHQNGQRERYKLRFRSYLNSNVDYLEVKCKDNHGCTQKSRIISENSSLKRTPDINVFLRAVFPLFQKTYIPTITNNFYRIALVSKYDQERLSLDLDIRFLSPFTQFSLPGMVVAEVKQPRFSVHSAFIQQMRFMGCRPASFSKYCVGVAMAYPKIKRNAFKPLLRDIKKIIIGGLN